MSIKPTISVFGLNPCSFWTALVFNKGGVARISLATATNKQTLINSIGIADGSTFGVGFRRTTDGSRCTAGRRGSNMTGMVCS